METWHVYQLRSDTELLYVGYTRRLKRRLSDHRRTKPWWPEVTQTPTEEFATEDAARQRERELWEGARPKYNRNSPFRTSEEAARLQRARVKRWKHAHPERRREYERRYLADPVNRETRRAADRERKRPTTVAGRRARWQQPGPSLFD